MILGGAHSHLTEFARAFVFPLPYRGSTEEEWPGEPIPTDVEDWAWRIGCPDWDGPGFDLWWQLFRRDVDASRIRRLILGNWVTDEDMDRRAEEIFGHLLRDKDAFTSLEALFVGDIMAEEHEISWIRQSDVTPLLEAFPDLKILGIRGSDGLLLQPTAHASLRELTFQAGGLPPEVVRALGECDLPALTELELYLGTDTYFGGSTAGDLTGLLSGARLPSLRYLGLRDADNADEVAAAVAHAPIVAQLEVLDLSLGTLGDEGAAALLAGQPLNHLKKLDLHHHYISEPMQERLRQAWPEVDVDLSGHQTPHSWTDREGNVHTDRYIAISE
jgi:hypothetical protein